MRAGEQPRKGQLLDVRKQPEGDGSEEIPQPEMLVEETLTITVEGRHHYPSQHARARPPFNLHSQAPTLPFPQGLGKATTEARSLMLVARS